MFYPVPDSLQTTEDAAEQPTIRLFSFHGSGGPLFAIHIVNVFLTLISSGIYYFWAKVKTRSYLLGHVDFDGDRFAYHGTGKEHLIGFLKALLVFGVPYASLQFLPELMGAEGIIAVIADIATVVIIGVLVPYVLIGVRRYRLSRTSWRGIRFLLRAATVDFVKLYVGGIVLSIITLGAYYPFFVTRRQAFLTSHTYLGNQQFHFDGCGLELSPIFVRACLMLPFTLGLSWFWFLSQKERYFWEHTSLATARFRSTIAWNSLLRLKVGNFLVLVLTFGLAWPWAIVRTMQYTLSNLILEGPLDPGGFVQQPQEAAAMGEGLADFLDTGFDLG